MLFFFSLFISFFCIFIYVRWFFFFGRVMYGKMRDVLLSNVIYFFFLRMLQLCIFG